MPAEPAAPSDPSQSLLPKCDRCPNINDTPPGTTIDPALRGYCHTCRSNATKRARVITKQKVAGLDAILAELAKPYDPTAALRRKGIGGKGPHRAPRPEPEKKAPPESAPASSQTSRGKIAKVSLTTPQPAPRPKPAGPRSGPMSIVLRKDAPETPPVADWDKIPDPTVIPSSIAAEHVPTSPGLEEPAPPAALRKTEGFRSLKLEVPEAVAVMLDVLVPVGLWGTTPAEVLLRLACERIQRLARDEVLRLG